MDYIGIKVLVSNFAVFATILQFLSGALVCKQYVVNRTTAEASALPFLCGFVSSILWALYGLSKNNFTIIFVNIIGTTLMLSYVIVFYMYTFKKSSVLRQIFVLSMFILIIIGYASTEEDSQRIVTLGYICCSITLVTIAAPMSKLFHVIKVKSAECLPFPLILMSFFVCMLWLMYGIIEDDMFIIVSNFIGGALGLIQLSLFLIYPRKSQPLVLNKNMIA